MIFILLVVYQLKHLLCDYPLQTPWMLRKFLGGRQWVLPLAAHAGVHGLFTLAITLFVNPVLWWLGLLDFVVHFTMDRIKASPNLLGRFKALSASEFKGIAEIISMPSGNPEIDLAAKYAKEKLKNNTYFWWSLGLDQAIHHLTHYAIIWILVSQ